MFEAIGNFFGNRANSMYQGSGVQQAVNFGQGLIGQMTGQNQMQQPGFSEQDMAAGRQAMFSQMSPEQQASVVDSNSPLMHQMQREQYTSQLTPEQQTWMGGADSRDPAIRARMPQAPAPKSDVLDPKSVNYKNENQQARRGGGGGVSAAQAPALGGGGGGAVGGGGTQYAGGIPVILRSYGEPSASLLKYIEG